MSSVAEPILQSVYNNFPRVARQWGEKWEPPEQLSLSQWAERYFYLSSEYAARTGPIKLFGWQREPLDSFTDPRVNEIVLMTGTQLIKTIFIQIALCYVIREAPGPVLLVEPKDADAKDFSKERLAPMLRDCQALKGLISDNRFDGNTIQFKEFPGGSLALVGALVPGNMARRSIRYMFTDEVDKYPMSAGSEGDPIKLGRERVATYGSRYKIIQACSPTVDGQSRIAKAYDETDQRKPWAACPECGQRQILKWGQVWFDKAKPRAIRHLTAVYVCEFCEAKWDDDLRQMAAENVEWRAESEFNGKAGFWINHLYSPWKALSKIVDDWLSCQGKRDELQVFVNTNLAELWRDNSEQPKWENVKERGEDYPFNDDAVVPNRASYLTAAVDVQKDWLAVELKAWGRQRESWSLGQWRLQSFDDNNVAIPTTDIRAFEPLNEFLVRTFPHESGANLSILAMAIDTGHNPNNVYKFTRNKPQIAVTSKGFAVYRPQTVVPVKGATNDQYTVIVGISTDEAARKRERIRIVSIGTACVKDEFYGDLNLKPTEDGQFPYGYPHLPRYDDWVFQGLCAEAKTRTDKGKTVWKVIFERNEPLDLHVYNRAMAEIIGLNKPEEWWESVEQKQGIYRKLEIVAPGAPQTPVEALVGDLKDAAEVVMQATNELKPVTPIAATSMTRRERKSGGWLGGRSNNWMRRD